MSERKFWIAQLDEARRRYALILGDLALEAAVWRPDPEANSIALTVWHVARAWDVLGTRMLGGREQSDELWLCGGWAERTGYNPLGKGWRGSGNLSGYSQEEVAEVPMLAPADLLAYLDEVYVQLRERLASAPESSLLLPDELPAQGPWQPAVFVRNFLADAYEHLGEIKALRAMWERRARGLTATW